jgi:hypothetical protein
MDLNHQTTFKREGTPIGASARLDLKRTLNVLRSQTDPHGMKRNVNPTHVHVSYEYNIPLRIGVTSENDNGRVLECHLAPFFDHLHRTGLVHAHRHIVYTLLDVILFHAVPATMSVQFTRAKVATHELTGRRGDARYRLVTLNPLHKVGITGTA